MFFWGKIQQPSCGGWEWTEGSKGLVFTPASFAPELQQALKNKGLRMKHGDKPPVSFDLLLILSVSLHTAFWVTVQFPGQFGNSRLFYRLFLDVPYWDAKAESAQILVCLVLFINQYALIGWSSVRQYGVPLPVPFLSFQSQQHSFLSLFPFLHIHIHLKYTTELYIFKISIMDSFWQFLSNTAFANTFTRNLDCHNLGITIIAQCYHNSTMF